MKRLLSISFLLLVTLGALAQNQRLVVRSFAQGDIGDMRARTSPVFDNNKKLAALLDISFAVSESTLLFEGIIGSPVHYPGEWLVRIPEGATRIKFSMEGCKPLEFAIPENIAIESGMVYQMDLDIEETVKLRTLVLPTFSAAFSSPGQLSYGLMLGMCKRNGGYLRVKSDFNFGLKTVGECDAAGLIDGAMGWYEGQRQTSRFAITAGYMRHIIDLGDKSSFYAYAGGGYGSRTLAWQMYGADGTSQYTKVTSHSFAGAEAELGVLFRVGGFAVSAGLQTNSFKFYEANLGIGVMF